MTTSPLALSILAETVLAGMPVYPSPANVYLPALGRRLLAFSDSRQEAARLGPRLSAQHDEQVIRALCVEFLGEDVAAADVVGLESTLQLLEGQIVASPSLRPYLEGQVKQLPRRSKRRETADGLITGNRSWPPIRHSLSCLILFPASVTTQSRRQTKVPMCGTSATGRRTEGKSPTDLRPTGGRVRRSTGQQHFRRKVGASGSSVSRIGDVGSTSVVSWIFTVCISSELVGFWPAFLAALLDTLRIDGAITLGSTEKDENVEIAGFSLGRYAAREAEGDLMRRFIGERSDQRRRTLLLTYSGKAVSLTPSKQMHWRVTCLEPRSTNSFKQPRMAWHRGSTSIYSAKLRMDILSRRFD